MKGVDKIIANVKASLAVEGLTPSKEGEAITRRYLLGEITSEEAIRLIKELYR
jgi:hypothetical protein